MNNITSQYSLLTQYCAQLNMYEKELADYEQMYFHHSTSFTLVPIKNVQLLNVSIPFYEACPDDASIVKARIKSLASMKKRLTFIDKGLLLVGTNVKEAEKRSLKEKVNKMKEAVQHYLKIYSVYLSLQA